MIIVTGGAGFIGSNLVKWLEQAYTDPIVVVDDMQDGHKFRNLVDLDIDDILDRQDFYQDLRRNGLPTATKMVIHQGACSDTMEWDGRYMLKWNFEFSELLLDSCMNMRIPFIYASSASVYGMNQSFAEEPDNEKPINMYGYSKLLFDRIVRKRLYRAKSQIVGLRYFNVFGPGEVHKGRMASVIWHFAQQAKETGKVRIFEGSHGYPDGEQRRDFIYVKDVVEVVKWFLHNPNVSGIFNLGTGNSESFNSVAKTTMQHFDAKKIEYIPFPENLIESYQAFTEADLSQLRAVGCDYEFNSAAEGIIDYLNILDKS